VSVDKEANQSSKADLITDPKQAMKLLREEHPTGIPNLTKLEDSCSDLGIDYEALKTIIPADQYLANARKVLDTVISNGEISRTFKEDFNRLGTKLQNILLGQKIWGDKVNMPSLALVTSDIKAGATYTTLEKDGSISFRKRARNQATRINVDADISLYKLELDQATGMFIPYQGDKLLTLKSQGEKLRQDLSNILNADLVQDSVAMGVSTDENKATITGNDKRQAVESYLERITGKTIAELNQIAGVKNIETEYYPVLKSLIDNFFNGIEAQNGAYAQIISELDLINRDTKIFDYYQLVRWTQFNNPEFSAQFKLKPSFSFQREGINGDLESQAVIRFGNDSDRVRLDWGQEGSELLDCLYLEKDLVSNTWGQVKTAKIAS
jgi:hypothetical protein